jgi:formate dehydrogenase assembly factor FdhD
MAMEKIATHKDCPLAVIMEGYAVLIQCPAELEELLVGFALTDECLEAGQKSIPTKAGIYIVDVEVWFEQGYYEGHKSDGESDWDFILKNVREAEVVQKSA